jgi:hypothetical protein
VKKGRTHAKRRRAWPRRLAISAGVAAVLGAGLWIGIHRVPWLGPALADGVRYVVGPGPVAFAEDVAYGAADLVNVWLYEDAAPASPWEVAPEPTATTAPAAHEPTAGETRATPPRFPPPPFEPPFAKVAAEGDGAWIPWPEPDAPPGPPALYRAALHPDPKRPFAVIAVVAIDLDRLELELVAGTHEPESDRVPRDHRPGLVPESRRGELVAAFNGGFKAMHGHYGMMLGGETFVAPRDIACTLAFRKNEELAIGTWSSMKADISEIEAYRQTPPCLVEKGEAHVGLSQEYNRNWGAAVDGDTIIRRSAIGLDASRRTLFYGLGDAVTAQSLGRGMRAVGAVDVAELDINYSYPRFLLYKPTSAGPRAAAGLIRDLKYKTEDYIVEPGTRDFFYLVRRRTTS